MTDALLEEAGRRSGVVWLDVPGVDRAQAVWQLWHAGAAHLVAGGEEQHVAGLADGTRLLVVVRSKERQADRVVQWRAVARQVLPGTPGWEELVPLLQARRLNSPDGGAQGERWAQDSTVWSLVPDGTREPVDRSG